MTDESARNDNGRELTPAERERADKLARLLRWREENPERVRELPRLWYARNKEKKLLRDVQRVRSLDPEAQWKRAEQRRRYESRPEVAERRRQRNAAPDVRARANARERLVRRLKALDLPPRRLTPTPAAYKRYYTRAADDFFTRKRDTAALARLKREAQPNTFVRFDRLVKSTVEIQRRITEAANRARTADELRELFLARYEPQLRTLIEHTNIRRAATGKSTRPIDRVVASVTERTVRDFLNERAAGSDLGDENAFLQYVAQRMGTPVRPKRARRTGTRSESRLKTDEERIAIARRAATELDPTYDPTKQRRADVSGPS